MDIGSALHRPVLSPDGNFLAVIVPELEIHIISLLEYSPGSRLYRRIGVPQTYHPLLSNATALRWSPESLIADDDTNTSSEVEFGTTWLLLTDGERIVALSVDLNSPRLSTQTDTNTLQRGNIMADYAVGNTFGKIATVDFVLNHRYVLVLFETNTQALVLNTTRTEMDQIPYPKFSDRRGFTQCPSNEHFALLLRSAGHDQVMVFKSSEPPTSFSPKSLDAQYIQWSPTGDPLLMVSDAAAYGVKVLFFTAAGQSLKHFEISTLDPHSTPSQGLGVVKQHWKALGSSSSIFALADGNRNILVRKQEARSTSTQPIAQFTHPDTIDGTLYQVWQESHQGPREFSSQKTAFAAPTPQDTSGEIDLITVNSDTSMLCTRTNTQTKALWLWRSHDLVTTPHAVFIFRDPIRQILWHPTRADVLTILTTPKDSSRTIYAWYEHDQAPAIGQLPLSASSTVSSSTSTPTPVPSKMEIQFLPHPSQNRYPLLLTTGSSYDLGLLRGCDREVIFESVLSADGLGSPPGQERDSDEVDRTVGDGRPKEEAVTHDLINFSEGEKGRAKKVMIEAEMKPGEENEEVYGEARWRNW